MSRSSGVESQRLILKIRLTSEMYKLKVKLTVIAHDHLTVVDLGQILIGTW